MQFKIHSIFISIFLFFVFTSNAQNGLNFQGVARNTNNIILASQPISLRLSIIRTSVNGTTEYAEVRKVTTNAQGLFSVVIGDTGSISSLGNFATIDWKLGPKFLKIEMDVAAGNNFVLIGTTQFQSVAYAQFAQSVDAEKLNGIVPVEKGGTGTTSLAAFKTALSLDKNTVGLSNVNNTADTAKPVSNATKLVLDTKVSSETFSNTIAQFTPIASPTFTGTVRGITKTMVGLGNIDNTADTAKPVSNATKLVLDTKVSTETFSSTILSKENAANKSTATDLGASAASDILFPTQKAVKTYVDAQSNAGGVADGGITTDKLAALAVTNAKLASGIDKAKVGLENVDNTSDAEKPISTATQLALDTKQSAEEYDFSLRTIPKLNSYNYYTEDNVFNGGETTIANLTLPNGILNLAAGTQIQSGAESPTVIQNRPNADFSIKTSTDEYGDGDPGAHEFKFTADGRLFFPDGGSRIVIDESQFGGQDVDVLSIRSKTGSYIELRTTSDEDDSYYWTFKDDGTIVFSDGNTSMGVITNGDNPFFGLRSPLGITLFSGNQSDDNSHFGLISISRDNESDPFEVGIVVNGDNEVNVWRYNSEGVLTFPDGTTLGGNYPETTYFELTTKENDGFKITTYDDPQNPIAWKFTYEGGLIFPDGTLMAEDLIDDNSFIFKVHSPNGLFLTSYNPEEENEEEAAILISPNNNQGKVIIETREYDEIGMEEIEKLWTYDSKGLLTFPDGTTLAGNYSGSTFFELNTHESNGFKITINGSPLKTWEFNLEGIMAFPVLEDEPDFGPLQEGSLAVAKPTGWDPLNKRGSAAYPVFYNGTDWVEISTSVASSTSTPTSIAYINPSLNTNYNVFTFDEFGAKLQSYQDGNGLDKEWSYNNDGSLTFPDGTIASGNISNTSNFGFDTRATSNGLSIITAGTSSGTFNLWEYGTDGILNLPGGASIGMVPYNYEEELQIYTPRGLLLKSSETNDKLWRFEADGNTVFPAGFTARYISADIIDVSSKFTIGGENIFDKFRSEVITLSGGSLSMYNDNTTHQFILNTSPRSNTPFTMYLNGMAVNKKNYTRNGNVITYTKSQTETELVVQFDYVKL